MLDVYVYYPRSPSLQPPRQVGQVQQPYRYADQGVQPDDHTPGRDAADARVRDALQKPHGNPGRDAGTTDDAAPEAPADDDSPAQGGGHIDTYA